MPWLFAFALKHVVHTAECVEWPVLTSASTPTVGGTPSGADASRPRA
jgi:hypothetical protein